MFQPFCRCNIAVILLTDLIVDHGVKVEWSAYLHLLLHAIFIGKLDSCNYIFNTSPAHASAHTYCVQNKTNKQTKSELDQNGGTDNY